MPDINKVILVGRLGKDPDIRTLQNGDPVASFPLATTERIRKYGAETELTEWHNVIMWRGLAKAAAHSLKKDKLVYIEGRCHTRSFTDRDETRKYTTEVVAHSFTVLGASEDQASITDFDLNG